MIKALENIAEALEDVAAREQAALEVLQGRGVELSSYSLNFPSEQRRHAGRIKMVAAQLKTCAEGSCFHATDSECWEANFG